MRSLTTMANTYTIRHHEPDTVNITADADLVDFLFYSYYNIVRFILLRLNATA
jgi:hypothetical protein